MVKIAIFKKNNSDLSSATLVVWRTSKDNLVGEVYFDGSNTKRGEWAMRATFYVKDNEATLHRVCEYFGFDKQLNNPYWLRFA